MHKIMTIISWAIIVIGVIGVIIASLCIGHATIDLNSWDITIGDWKRFISFWISVPIYLILFAWIERTGYKRGFKDGVKSTKSK